MNVLELTCEPILHGGQEAFIFNCLGNMPQNDIEIDVLTLYYCQNENYRSIVQKRGGQVFELNIDFRPGKSRKLIKKPLCDFLSSHQYDIIHIHSGSISALAYSAEVAKSVGIKHVIVHSHSTGINNLKHKLIQTAFAHKFKKNVSVFCACSVEAGEMKFPKSVKSQTIVLKNGINLQKFDYDEKVRKAIRAKLGIPEDAYLVGQIGRYTFEKNQLFMVDIAEKVIGRDNRVFFLFIGDGELRKEAEEKAKSNRNVIFLDAQNDIWQYYNALDLFVLPSLYEGIPLVSIEAQANGLPILASTGVSKEIEINDNVERLEFANTEKWIDKILNKDSRTTKLVIRSSGWDISEVVNNLMNLYISRKADKD